MKSFVNEYLFELMAANEKAREDEVLEKNQPLLNSGEVGLINPSVVSDEFRKNSQESQIPKILIWVMDSISKERRTNKAGSIDSQMSHERSQPFINTIRAMMTAARPHKNINIYETITTCLQGSTAEKGLNITRLMIKRIMNATPNPIAHQPKGVQGHPRMRCINVWCDCVALPGTLEVDFILRLLCK